ncbi:MAG: hypothetical protein JWR37_2569 [Mycobacterium sp.]|nr:hypothetical protein [Mycobacterium sp.]
MPYQRRARPGLDLFDGPGIAVGAGDPKSVPPSRSSITVTLPASMPVRSSCARAASVGDGHTPNRLHGDRDRGTTELRGVNPKVTDCQVPQPSP